MIYLLIINANMKKKANVIRISLWVTLGVVILLSNLALNRTRPPVQSVNAISATQTGTTSADSQVSEAGSTDGIMFVALVIVLIVVIPILLKRQAWVNGKRNKIAPPS